MQLLLLKMIVFVRVATEEGGTRKYESDFGI